MSEHESNGALAAPAIESAEDKALGEILRAQPLSDESPIKFIDGLRKDLEKAMTVPAR